MSFCKFPGRIFSGRFFEVLEKPFLEMVIFAKKNKMDTERGSEGCMKGNFVGHTVEVAWDSKASSFHFRIQLETGHTDELQYHVPSTSFSHKSEESAKRKRSGTIQCLDLFDFIFNSLLYFIPQSFSFILFFIEKNPLVGEEDDDVKEQGLPMKRYKSSNDQDVTNVVVEGTINSILPVEVLEIILHKASQSSEGIVSFVGRHVCRLWFELLPIKQVIQVGTIFFCFCFYLFSIVLFFLLSFIFFLSFAFFFHFSLKQDCKEPLFDSAVRMGWFAIVKWLRKQGFPWGKNTLRSAARGGHWEIFQWALNKGCRPMTIEGRQLVCAAIAGEGNLEALKLARQKGFEWGVYATMQAANNGHFEVLKWAIENGCPFSQTTCSAAARGAPLEALQWLREKGCPWGLATVWSAARRGNLEILKWALDNGCKWSPKAAVEAAKYGHVHILEWVRDANLDFQESQICENAAGKSQFEVLKWARAQNYDWGNTCREAAQKGNLEILKWAKENGCPWDELTCNVAAQKGHLHVLEWAVENGCPIDYSACLFGTLERSGILLNVDILKWCYQRGGRFATEEKHWLVKISVRRSYVDVLKWFVEEGIVEKAEICNARQLERAAQHGKLKVLNYLRSEGVVWPHGQFTHMLVRKGYIDILKWLVEEGIEKKDKVCERHMLSLAARNGWLDMMKWMRREGAEWPEDIYLDACQSGSPYMLKWLLDHDAPLSQPIEDS